MCEKFYKIRKYHRAFLRLHAPARLNSSGMPSEGDPDLSDSFRHVLKKITNPIVPLPNHHFRTFLFNYTEWRLYRGCGGVISLYG